MKLGASLRKDREVIKTDLDAVFELFPRLKERTGQHAGTLSGGEQQMLAIGRGLMAGPTLLCMDEPSLGLAPIVIERLGEVIRDINQRGVTVLLVEQNVHLSLGVAGAACALQVGRVVLEGDINPMRSSDVVRRAYLGGQVGTCEERNGRIALEPWQPLLVTHRFGCREGSFNKGRMNG